MDYSVNNGYPAHRAADLAWYARPTSARLRQERTLIFPRRADARVPTSPRVGGDLDQVSIAIAHIDRVDRTEGAPPFDWPRDHFHAGGAEVVRDRVRRCVCEKAQVPAAGTRAVPVSQSSAVAVRGRRLIL